MTREEKISAIHKEIANTDIDEWCVIEAYWERWVILDYNWTRAYVWWYRWDFEKFDDYQHLSIKLWYEVIWRPVMIWDVIDWIEKKTFDINKKIPWFWFEEDEEISDESKLYLIQDYYIDNVISYWDTKREPVEAQSEDCIDYIYSLIPSISME